MKKCHYFGDKSPNLASMLGQKQLDIHFGRSCRGMSLSDFTYLLSLVSDTLSELTCLSTSQLICLVHLSAVLLREHPSRKTCMVICLFCCSANFSLCLLVTLAHIQKFATRCINGFSGYDIFVHGPLQLRLQVLDLLARHCSDQVSTSFF